MKRYCLGVIFLFCAPLSVLAAGSIQISEIAWMGDKNASTNEWLELHNTGDAPVALAGWKLVSSDGKLSISLKGSIAVDGYYLIERTNDNAVPNVPADLIASFGTGLSNSGMTLRVLDASTSVVDEVIGGTDWKNAGGDNETKSTAQRTASGWVTAPATPRSATIATMSDPVPAKATSTEDVSCESTSSSSEKLVTSTATDSPTVVINAVADTNSPALPTHDLSKLTVRVPLEVFASEATKFHADAFGYDGGPFPALVKWNFGDGTTAVGADATHTYAEAGAYSVGVSAQIGIATYRARFRVRALADEVRIAGDVPGIAGSVRLSANSDVDISGWTLRDAGTSFIFPDDSRLVAGETVVFPNKITGIDKHVALGLFRPDGLLVAAGGEASRDDEPDDSMHVSYSSTREYAAHASSFFEPTLRKKQIDVSRNETSSTASTSDWAASVSGASAHSVWSYIAVGAFIVAALTAIAVYSRRLDPDREIDAEAAKYTLIEVDSNLEDIS